MSEEDLWCEASEAPSLFKDNDEPSPQQRALEDEEAGLTSEPDKVERDNTDRVDVAKDKSTAAAENCPDDIGRDPSTGSSHVARQQAKVTIPSTAMTEPPASHLKYSPSASLRRGRRLEQRTAPATESATGSPSDSGADDPAAPMKPCVQTTGQRTLTRKQSNASDLDYDYGLSASLGEIEKAPTATPVAPTQTKESAASLRWDVDLMAERAVLTQASQGQDAAVGVSGATPSYHKERGPRWSHKPVPELTFEELKRFCCPFGSGAWLLASTNKLAPLRKDGTSVPDSRRDVSPAIKAAHPSAASSQDTKAQAASVPFTTNPSPPAKNRTSKLAIASDLHERPSDLSAAAAAVAAASSRPVIAEAARLPAVSQRYKGAGDATAKAQRPPNRNVPLAPTASEVLAGRRRPATWEEALARARWVPPTASEALAVPPLPLTAYESKPTQRLALPFSNSKKESYPMNQRASMQTEPFLVVESTVDMSGGSGETSWSATNHAFQQKAIRKGHAKELLFPSAPVTGTSERTERAEPTPPLYKAVRQAEVRGLSGFNRTGGHPGQLREHDDSELSIPILREECTREGLPTPRTLRTIAMRHGRCSEYKEAAQ